MMAIKSLFSHPNAREVSIGVAIKRIKYLVATYKIALKILQTNVHILLQTNIHILIKRIASLVPTYKL